MSLGVKETIRNEWLETINLAMNMGSAGAKLKFYSGLRPATGQTPSGTLLATVRMANPSAGVVSGGILTFYAFTEDSSAAATGITTWARITDSDNNFIADCSVGLSGSGTDIIMNSTDIVAGGIVRISSGSITAGNA